MVRKKKVVLLVLFMFITLLIDLTSVKIQNSKDLKNTEIKLKLSSDSPIIINGNNDLATAASAGVGSKANPYIIQNKVIDNGNNEIQNTNKFFILRNCTFNGGNYGIFMNNVTYANISNDYFYNMVLYGIVASLCENSTFSNNQFNNNMISGLAIDNSMRNNITNNEMNNNGVNGLALLSSTYIIISLNTINDNVIGILLSTSNYNTITYNTLDNNDQGIEEISCIGNVFDHNTVNDNAAKKTTKKAAIKSTIQWFSLKFTQLDLMFILIITGFADAAAILLFFITRVKKDSLDLSGKLKITAKGAKPTEKLERLERSTKKK